MSRDRYMAAHESLIEEFLDANPDAEWEEAYFATCDDAWEREIDIAAEQVDRLRQMRRDAE